MNLNKNAHPNAVSQIVDYGVEVVKLFPSNPASEAGLLEGDIVLTINDEKVKSVNHFVRSIKQHNAGEQITLTVLRKALILEYKVDLGVRPEGL